MERTRIFISYSQRDRGWLDRLGVHLSILERRGLVQVWSDAQVSAGSRWQDEIEKALSVSQVAALLISADFLASDNIWELQMSRILAHVEQGMELLPLIIRPCAWRVAPELAERQPRPADGRALSLLSDPEIDLALATIVYELAARVAQIPSKIAQTEVEVGRLVRAASAARAPTPASRESVEPSVTEDKGRARDYDDEDDDITRWAG